MTPPLKKVALILRLLMLFSMFVVNITVVSLVVSYVLHTFFGLENPLDAGKTGNFSPPELNAVLIMQAFATLGGFLLTAIMFSVLESGEFINHLRLTRPLPWKMILLAVFAMLVAEFFIGSLMDLNNKIQLPASLQWIKELEKETEDQINAFLDFRSVRRFILVSTVLAVIPAIAEEIFFRGLLLGDLLKAKVNPALAIIATGFVFALVHFEFYNTLAIWAFGCFLGYLYYISGSIWLPIVAHFVNNFVDLLLKYLYNTKVLSVDLSNTEVPVYLSLISLVIFAGCLFIFNKWKVQPSFVEVELPNEELTE